MNASQVKIKIVLTNVKMSADITSTSMSMHESKFLKGMNIIIISPFLSCTFGDQSRSVTTINLLHTDEIHLIFWQNPTKY